MPKAAAVIQPRALHGLIVRCCPLACMGIGGSPPLYNRILGLVLRVYLPLPAAMHGN